MKTAKHTPGPWFVNPDHGMLVMARITENADFAGKQLVVANVDYQQTVAGGSKNANARLIAAAPELLAVLEKILPLAEAEAANLDASVDSPDADKRAEKAALDCQDARTILAKSV